MKKRIDELFSENNMSLPITWIINGKFFKRGVFYSKSGSTFRISFRAETNFRSEITYWEVTFANIQGREPVMEPTKGDGVEQFSIYHTVFNAMIDFLKKSNPPAIHFIGATDAQTKLYTLIVKRLASRIEALGYRIEYNLGMSINIKRNVSLTESVNYTNGKIIAYHGSGSKIDQFYKTQMTPHYFTQDIEYAKAYSGSSKRLTPYDKPKKTKNYLFTVELDIKHLFDTKEENCFKIYNDEFIPHMNQLRAKYPNLQSFPILEKGSYVNFVYADYLYRYLLRFHPEFDGMLVDEGKVTSEPAIVPFDADQIKIIKKQIV